MFGALMRMRSNFIKRNDFRSLVSKCEKKYNMHPKLSETFAKYEKIIFVGGGTGGHISPIVSLASELKNKEVVWIGWRNSQEKSTAEKEWITFLSISTLKLSTTKSPKILLYPFFLIKGVLESREILSIIREKQICVFSKWWPGAVAVGIAAWILGIPLYIHESDTIPGRSNTLLGKFAQIIFLWFESTKKYFSEEKCEIIGQIIDPLLIPTANESSRKNDETEYFSRKNSPSFSHPRLKWQTDKTHILVYCGSQWARTIFEEIIASCSDLDVEWVIVLGKLNLGIRKDFEKFENIQILDWLEKKDQKTLFEWTNMAITRGSATTLAELDLFHIQKIIIPLPDAARNHQYWNAKEYEKKWDVLLEQKNIYHLINYIHYERK